MSDKIISNYFEKENNSYLVTTITKCHLEFTPSLYPIVIRCQDSLKTFWLWCDTTKCANLRKSQRRQKGG